MYCVLSASFIDYDAFFEYTETYTFDVTDRCGVTVGTWNETDKNNF